jgi:hypothetical protein
MKCVSTAKKWLRNTALNFKNEPTLTGQAKTIALPYITYFFKTIQEFVDL